MAKKKRLSPIPFEAQQAQSEWLLDRFDKGLNSYENHEDETYEYWQPPRHLRRSAVPYVRPFNIAVPEISNWLSRVRSGEVESHISPFTVCYVTTRYESLLNLYVFTTHYKEETFTYTIHAEEVECFSTPVEEMATRGLLRLIERYKNEQAERPRL